MHPIRRQRIKFASSGVTALDVLEKICPLAAPAWSCVSSLIGGGQKHGCNPRFVTHSRSELLGKSNASGIGINHPPVAQASIVVPDGRQIPFGEMVFPRSGVGQIKVVTLDYTVLNPCLGKLGMELERYRTLSYAGAAPDKQHFTSYVRVLSMVQMLTIPFPWIWDVP